MNPLVCIVMGSENDRSVMSEAVEILRQFDVPHEVQVLSAHRSPGKLRRYLQLVEARDVKVVIAGAGASAHLAGVIAAEVVIPVIAVPLSGSPLKGIDALLSMVQMPAGVPVATMGLDASGARNAALLAVQILGLSDATYQQKFRAYKAELEERYAEPE